MVTGQDTDAVWSQLEGIFREVMDDPGITIQETTTASDISRWDSITHVLLILAVEKKFKVKFRTTEIQSLQNVGELVALIRSKRS